MRPSAPDLFTRPAALAAGWTDGLLRGAVARGEIVRVRPGHFRNASSVWDLCQEAIVASRCCEGSVISHRSAAAIHRLPLLVPPGRPDLTVRPGGTGDTSGALVHRATLRPQDVVLVGEVAVTSVARTIGDLARCTSVTSGVVAADAALQRGLVDLPEIEDVWQMCRRWPGGRRIRAVTVLSDARSESPLESLSRLAIRDLGLPMPQLQAVLFNDAGGLLGRTDFYWDEFGVVGEADGRSKYTDRTVLTAEKYRQEAMEDAGLIVVRWTWDDIRRRRNHLAVRLRRAFARGRRRDLTFPRQWSVMPPGTTISGETSAALSEQRGNVG